MYRDSISHVIHFERCVNAYKASNDSNLIDPLMDYISMVSHDKVQKLSTMRGNSKSFLI